MSTWDDVENSEKYQSLPPELKLEFGKKYFNQVIAEHESYKALPPEKKKEFELKFFSQFEIEKKPAEGPVPGTTRFKATMSPLIRGIANVTAYNPLTAPIGLVAQKAADVFDERMEEVRKEETKRYAGLTSREAMIKDRRESGLLSDMLNTVSESNLGKILYSFNDKGLRERVESVVPKGYQYTPKHPWTSMLAGLGVDLPLYELGTMIGGPFGTFSIPAFAGSLAESRIAGELDNPSATMEYAGRIASVAGKAWKEAGAGALEGLLLHGVGKLSGRVLEEIGLYRAYKAIKPEGMAFKAFREAFTGMYQPSKIAKIATDIVTQAPALTATSILHGQMPTAEELKKNFGLIGLLRVLHVPFEGKRIKIDYRSKIEAADKIAADIGAKRTDILKAMKTPEGAEALQKIYIDKLKEENAKIVKEKVTGTGMLPGERELETPVTPAEQAPAPELENVVRTVYPRGWDETRKKVVQRAYTTEKYVKQRDQMDQVISAIWPDIKKNQKILQDVINDKSILRDYIDAKASGFDRLKPVYQKNVLREIKQMAENELRGYATESTADIKPYQKIVTWNLGSEANRQAFEMMEAKRIPQKTMALKEDGSTVVMPSFSEIIGKEGAHEVEQRAVKIASKYFSEGPDIDTSKVKRLGRFIDYRFISSLDARMGATEAGKEMAQMTKAYERNMEFHDGESEAGLKRVLLKVERKEKIPAHIDTAIVDMLDYGEIKERKIKLSRKEREKVRKAAREIRGILDGEFYEGKKIGLKEYHPSVAEWDYIKNESGGYTVVDGEGRQVAIFNSEKQARDFKLKNMYTELQYRGNYFPHKINPEKLKDIIERKRLAEWLVDTGQIGDLPALENKTPEEVRKLKVQAAERLLVEEGLNTRERRMGNLQIERRFNLPESWLIRDTGVLYQYLAESANRLERAKMFGINDEIIFSKAIEVAQEAGIKYNRERAAQEWHNALNLAQALTGRIAYDMEAHAMANALLNFQVIRKMVLSPLSQIPQSFYGIWRAGKIMPFIRGLNSLRKPEMRELITRSGVNLKASQRWLIDQFGGATLAEKLLKYNKFIKMDMNARAIGAATGNFFADWVGHKLGKNYSIDEGGMIRKNGKLLRMDKKGVYYDRPVREAVKLDLDPKELIAQKGKLNDLQRRTAIRKFEVDTNFRAYVWNQTEFRQSIFGKMVTQFKQFNYSMTKSLRDNVIKEMKYGNFRPLLYLAVVCGIGGAITDEIRGMITGRESGIKRLTENDLTVIAEWLISAGALGIFGDLIYGTKYGDPGLGAAFNDLLKTSSMLSQAMKAKEPKTAAGVVIKTTAGMLPVGGRFKRTTQMLLGEQKIKPSDLIIMPREKVSPRKYPDTSTFQYKMNQWRKKVRSGSNSYYEEMRKWRRELRQQ